MLSARVHTRHLMTSCLILTTILRHVLLWGGAVILFTYLFIHSFISLVKKPGPRELKAFVQIIWLEIYTQVCMTDTRGSVIMHWLSIKLVKTWTAFSEA